jgi:hypothetical protein
MKNLLVAMALLTAATALPAWATEATFERDITVSGKPDLTVQTGSGSIHLMRGTDSRIHVIGRVHSFWGADEDQVRRIVSNPPVEQTGNIVRIGMNNGGLHNISIDYEIEAPAGAYLHASTGSGGITDDGVGEDTKLNTGSGSIHATGLHGGFTLGTGSGSIFAEQSGEGSVRAGTGSGSIELHDIHGAVDAHTGSGSIKVEGTPAEFWKISTGSGSVELWTGSAALTLDAGSGSGGIHVDREMMTTGTLNHHHITGRIGGGGPTVQVHTGSGGIHVH